jgi:hypothetical protein
MMVNSEQEQAIREAAYHKWEQAGRPHGDGREFWLESEQELQGHPIEPNFESEIHDGLGPEIKIATSRDDGLSGTSQQYETSPPSEEFQQDSRSARRSRRRAT